MGLLFAALYKEKPADYALLASNQYNAQRLYEFLLNFLSEDEVVFFPADELLRAESLSSSRELLSQRLYGLHQLLSPQKKILVTHPSAALRFLPDPKRFAEETTLVKKGAAICFSPEGMSSISGHNQPVVNGLGRFFKKYSIPVYIVRLSGAYLTNTKYCLDERKGLIKAKAELLYSPEYLKSATPEEIEESAKVDGATEWQLFWRIVLPLVAPGIAAVAMLSFMYAWNEYTYTVIFTRSPSNYTVPLALSVLNTEDNLTNFGLVAAGGVVSVIPITLFVIFAQNYLISGLSSGAVKE